MLKVTTIVAAIALLCLGSLAHANVTIDTVRVDGPGNTADSTGYGSVAYNYNIGKYEITAAQYTEFLNHKAKTDTYGLYDSGMWSWGCRIQQVGASGNYSYSVASEWANRPVNVVSFWDACRFANWLNNGQGNGATETGAYTLNGYTGQDGRTISRDPEAIWFLPTEDEWYKAAYYKGGSTDAGYWDYPTKSDSINTAMANYGGSVGNTTDAGFYAYSSAYGTFDQAGNVWEWNEAVRVIDAGANSVAQRGRRGDWYGGSSDLSATNRSDRWPNEQSEKIGFRIASVETVPEPSAILALLCGVTGLGGAIWRRVAR